MKQTIKFQLADRTGEPLNETVYECEIDTEVMLGRAIPLRPTAKSIIRIADVIVMRPCRICKGSPGHPNLLEYVQPEGKQATGEFKEMYLAGEIAVENTPAKTSIDAGVNAGEKLSSTQEKIIALLAGNGSIPQVEIAKRLEINEATVYRNIEKLKQLGLVERKGSDKTGVWVVKSLY